MIFFLFLLPTKTLFASSANKAAKLVLMEGGCQLQKVKTTLSYVSTLQNGRFFFTCMYVSV